MSDLSMVASIALNNQNDLKKIQKVSPKPALFQPYKDFPSNDGSYPAKSLPKGTQWDVVYHTGYKELYQYNDELEYWLSLQRYVDTVNVWPKMPGNNTGKIASAFFPNINDQFIMVLNLHTSAFIQDDWTFGWSFDDETYEPFGAGKKKIEVNRVFHPDSIMLFYAMSENPTLGFYLLDIKIEYKLIG